MTASVLRILVVDDDVFYRDRLARALRSRGYDVMAVGSAEEADDLPAGWDPQGAVLDLRLPGVDGLECLKRLKRKYSSARVVMLTGYGSIASAMAAVRKGARDYLIKPADADQVLSALLRSEDDAEDAGESPPVASLGRLEWEHIQRVLADCRGNVSRAASVLGLHRRSLQRKLRKFPPGE
jgi:two-component system response regulator RegA